MGYAETSMPSRSETYVNEPVRTLIDVTLMLCLVPIHVVLSWKLSEYLFGRSGGVHQLSHGWTSFGGISMAWTSLAWLPGSTLTPLNAGLDSVVTRF